MAPDDFTGPLIQISVAYATPQMQWVVPLSVPEGITLERAILLSEVRLRFPDIDLGTAKVGVFGKLRKLSDLVQDGDRIEIYRPLLADPKAARKKRTTTQKI